MVAFPLQWPKLPVAIQDRHGDRTPDLPHSDAGSALGLDEAALGFDGTADIAS